MNYIKSYKNTNLRIYIVVVHIKQGRKAYTNVQKYAKDPFETPVTS